MPDRPTLALAAVLSTAVWAVPASGREILDRVLAIVGGHIVTLSDARAAVALGLAGPSRSADPIADAVAVLIDRRLILTEVDRYQVPDPDAAAVERRLAELAARLPADVPLDLVLSALALDREGLRRLARDDLRMAAYLAQRFGLIRPSDEEVAAYYRERAADLAQRGVVPPLAEVAEALRESLAASRRDQLVAQWVADLRRRTDIVVLYPGEPAPVRR